MTNNDIVIVAAKRTPIGAFLGQFAELPAPKLGATAIHAALAATSLAPEDIDEVLMGCVLPAGLGQAPARQAALQAGLPVSTPCTTVNKVCGSGMQAVMLGHDLISAGSAHIVVAGGMESMSNAPYLVAHARRGLRIGHGELLDHMLYDGLQNAEDGALMGTFAERCVARYGFTREEQDAYAAESVNRALAASTDGAFSAELTPVSVTTTKGEQSYNCDETPFKCDVAKIPKLKPAFQQENGTVTAASSASISDGAAALVLMREAEAKQRKIPPLARIIAHTSHARAPADFTIAPIDAVKTLYRKTGWSAGDVDLFEINEAFAAVTLAALRDLQLDPHKVNINGGACALGHPIGASGARILVTLLHALRRHDLARGIAALCIGGGEATAIAIEAL